MKKYEFSLVGDVLVVCYLQSGKIERIEGESCLLGWQKKNR